MSTADPAFELRFLTQAMLTEPLPWALERIRAARAVGPIPLYGGDEWHQLPASDPRRWAACIVAGEAWRDHRSPERVAVELRRELEEADLAVLARLKDASIDVAGATDWTAQAAAPTHEALQRRRARPHRPGATARTAEEATA